jgi:hypothetical protein
VKSDSEGSGRLARLARDAVDPAYVVALYVLAIVGLFVAPRPYTVLALLLLAYNTLAAAVFAGAVRYRAPWDFLLALFAAFALAWLWETARRRFGYRAREPAPAR